MFKQHSFSGHATVNMGVIVTGLSTRLLFSDEARSQNAELNEQVSYKHVCFVIVPVRTSISVGNRLPITCKIQSIAIVAIDCSSVRMKLA